MVQGTSRGLGLALTEALLQDPEVDLVIATSRSPRDSSGLTALDARFPGRLQRVQMDVTDPASIEAAAAQVRVWTERLQLLINVSGLLHDASGLGPERRLDAVSQDSLRRVFDVNAFGPILVARAFEGLLRHDEPAVLANISARVGSIEDNRLGGWYAYRASKAAQNQLTKTLAIEMRRRAKNLTVVALHPGTVQTDLSAPFRRNVKPEKLFSPQRSAQDLLTVMRGLTPADSGRFLAYDGTVIPW
jgi:NAD(P)-dependent dehydrogenase (short-subunit alcohol dehydrogenase family)